MGASTSFPIAWLGGFDVHSMKSGELSGEVEAVENGTTSSKLVVEDVCADGAGLGTCPRPIVQVLLCHLLAAKEKQVM